MPPSGQVLRGPKHEPMRAGTQPVSSVRHEDDCPPTRHPFVQVKGFLEPVQALKRANRRHSPGTPFSAWAPRSSNSIPEPTTRSFTVLDTSTWLGAAIAATRAPM